MFQHAAHLDTPPITPAEEVLLRAAANDRGVAYNTGSRRDNAAARMFTRLAAAGAVVFTDARAGGWDKGMWAMHMTAIGWNTLFRWHAADVDGVTLDRHIGRVDIDGYHLKPCDGFWGLDGTCNTCGATRPLDNTAYNIYLDNITDETRAVEERAPRLFCPEHGRMRARHITTKKVCLLRGSDFHDGGLNRL